MRILQRKLSHLLDSAHLVSVTSGAEALQRVQTDVFDVILLDMHMPSPMGPDGLPCAQIIREGSLPGPASQANKFCHIVAVTTESQPEHRDTYRAASLDGLIPKPVCQSHLQAFLEAVQQQAVCARDASEAPGMAALGSRGESGQVTLPLPPAFNQQDRAFFDGAQQTKATGAGAPASVGKLYLRRLKEQTRLNLNALERIPLHDSSCNGVSGQPDESSDSASPPLTHSPSTPEASPPSLDDRSLNDTPYMPVSPSHPLPLPTPSVAATPLPASTRASSCGHVKVPFPSARSHPAFTEEESLSHGPFSPVPSLIGDDDECEGEGDREADEDGSSPGAAVTTGAGTSYLMDHRSRSCPLTPTSLGEAGTSLFQLPPLLDSVETGPTTDKVISLWGRHSVTW